MCAARIAGTARSAVAFLLVLAGAVLGPQSAAAQMTAADSAAVLWTVAEDLEGRGDRAVALTLWREIARRFPGTPAAGDALARLAVLEADAVAGGGGGVPASDAGFRAWVTLYGVWVGAAIPAIADAQGTEPYGAGILVGGPLAYIGARAFTRARSLSAGQARAITWGGTWGTWQGAGWAHALSLGEDEFCMGCGPDGPAVAAAALAGGVAGILTGGLISADGAADGTTAAAYLGSLWGTWFGIAGSMVLDYDDDAAWRSVLLAGNAGLALGALGGRGFGISSRRAHLVSLGGLIGGTGGVGVVLIARPQSESADFGIPLATSVVGLAAALVLTRDGDAESAEPEADSPPPPLFGALLNWSEGRFSLGAPLPVPVSEFGAAAGGMERRAGWRATLATVRF